MSNDNGANDKNDKKEKYTKYPNKMILSRLEYGINQYNYYFPHSTECSRLTTRYTKRICVFSETFDKISVNKYYSRLKFLRKPSKQMTPIVRVNFEPCQLFIIPQTIWNIEKKMWIKYIVSYIILRFTLYLTFN